MEPSLIRAPERRASKRLLTDAFQVFCAEHRPDVSSLNPTETVGTITSILASRWRAMSAAERQPYAMLAKQFDRSQGVPDQRMKQPPARGLAVDLVLPCIYIVKRPGCSELIHEASITSLTASMVGGGHASGSEGTTKLNRAI
jgi:hypothetical protein